MPHVNLASPALLLAPHTVYPAHNGSDILVDRTARYLSMHVPFVDVLTSEEVLRFQDGRISHRELHGGQMRSKVLGAMRTVVLRSHYYKEKFLTPNYKRLARRYLSNETYQLVLASYITTAELLLKATKATASRVEVAMTHNDEFRWFQDLYATTKNPLGKLAARSSKNWLHRFLPRYAQRFVYAHVTQTDLDGFGKVVPNMLSIVMPIGADIEPEPAPPIPTHQSPIRLLFVGSLSVQMNFDALQFFSVKYYPRLKEAFGDSLAIDIAGSNPTTAVESLCDAHGWSLHPNVSDEALQALYARSLFALLPFGYATGAKLKLLGALGHGVPVLATRSVQAQADMLAPPSFMSDDAQDWIDHIHAVHASGLSQAQRASIRALAMTYSWQASVQHLLDGLRALD